jgi:predicted nucleic acid-binding protein
MQRLLWHLPGTGVAIKWTDLLLMHERKITFYDASYLAMAYETDSVLVTADEKFVKKMKGIEKMMLLKDLTLGS